MADGFDFGGFGDFNLGGMETPALDAGGFSLFGGDSGGVPSLTDYATPSYSGFQDWMNALGTGEGTYGTGVEGIPGAYDPAAGGTPSEPAWMQQLRAGQQPAAQPSGWQGGLQAGAQGLGALGSILGLGVSGLGMANAVKAMQQGGQQQKIMGRAQEQMQQAQQAQQAQAQQLNQVAAPAARAGASLTAAGEQAMLGGPLPGQMESMVEKWRNENKARINNYLAKTGISDSTMAAQFQTWTDQLEGMYRQQLAESLLKGGYSGVQTATGPMGAAGNTLSGAASTAGGLANTASSQMGGTDRFLQEANRSIGLLTGAQR